MKCKELWERLSVQVIRAATGAGVPNAFRCVGAAIGSGVFYKQSGLSQAGTGLEARTHGEMIRGQKR